ncbi:MAG: hypothetical protein MRZ79_12970 [Bacteroidia bacterium]|nr:hypothetical protein [Bacteroidia bacterium]
MGTKKSIRRQEQEFRELEKAIGRFSDHFMSNAKWVRLIDKLVEHAHLLKRVEFKKVGKDQIGTLSLSEDSSFGFDYWTNGFEGHNSLGGWLLYKEIEYLVFPQKVYEKGEQDLDEILRILNVTGKFELDVDQDRIKLICYR